ncbi:MAG: TlyA family RNA methyltransferase [Lachnospiraceae bacterium]|nr:TlyA family RNA methyltransferase [Lachnospiraceae bacterium]
MKSRLDVFLVEKGLAPSRSRAQSLIESGCISVNGKAAAKSSMTVEEEDEVTVTGLDHPFVSRGGLKLLKALECFNVDVTDKTCADLGASTGGFTDCLLKHGADYVYAVDTGHDQLSEELKSNSHVCNMEGVNARDLNASDFERRISVVVSDVSFISLTKILPAIYNISEEDMDGLCLIKPQFEAGREHIGKKGVVKDRKVHLSVLENIYDFCVNTGFTVENITYSPIRGPEGNIEYLLHLKKKGSTCMDRNSLKRIVNEGFSNV